MIRTVNGVVVPRFNIICEGPSAALARQKDLLPKSCTVAINMALRVAEDQKITVHVWTMEDHPANLWKYVQRWHPRTRTIWGSERHRGEWHSRGFKDSQLYLWEHHAVTDEPDALGRLMLLPTVLVTIAKAVAHGAREILLVGADMKGSGSPFTPWSPWVEDEGKLASRWEKEREGIAHAVKRCADVGCVLEHWKPAHEAVA